MLNNYLSVIFQGVVSVVPFNHFILYVHVFQSLQRQEAKLPHPG